MRESFLKFQREFMVSGSSSINSNLLKIIMIYDVGDVGYDDVGERIVTLMTF